MKAKKGEDPVLPRKLMLAWVLKDYKMLLSSDITNDSQVLMYRNIVERIRKIVHIWLSTGILIWSLIKRGIYSGFRMLTPIPINIRIRSLLTIGAIIICAIR
jgi:hypothetical protein